MKTSSSVPVTGWIEVLLAVVISALMFQLFPSVVLTIIGSMDFRAWARTTWISANLGVLVILLTVQFLPTLRDYLGSFLRRQSQTRANIENNHHVGVANLPPKLSDHFHEGKDTRLLLRQEEERRRLAWITLARFVLIVAVIVLVLGFVTAQLTSTRLSEFDDGHSLLRFAPSTAMRDDIEGVVGISVRVPSSTEARITHLGVYDHDGDGLQLDHRVGILEVDETRVPTRKLIVEATIPFGHAAELQRSFRWVAVNVPVVLKGGRRYMLVAETFKDCDDKWPKEIGVESLKNQENQIAWNAAIIDRDHIDELQLMITDKRWPAIPGKVTDVTGAQVHGPVNLRFELVN